MKENEFQKKIIRKLYHMFGGKCIVLKNDENYIQGIPDLTVLHGKRWAFLETKQHANSPVRPNQEYYIRVGNEMSFARFINEENYKEVLDELQKSLKS